MIHLAAFIDGKIVEEIKFKNEKDIAYWKFMLIGLAGPTAKVFRKTESAGVSK